MIQAIILDFDGVIHDTLAVAFRINALLHPDITLEEYKDFFNGNIYDHPKITPETSEKFFELQHEEYKELEIEREIREELKELKGTYELFIITSNKELTLKHYFENNDIHELFNEVLGYETHASKEEKFRLIFDKHNLDVDDCVFVTDTLGDILEAKKVGITTIAVDFGFHERERLEKGKPFKIISDFKEIKKVIEDMHA